MKKAVGLYTEIVVTIFLLLVAALLFSGFLLVRLTEQELVDQRIKSAGRMTELLSRSFLAGDQGGPSSDFNLSNRVDALSGMVSSVAGLITWGVVDHDLAPLPISTAGDGYELDMSELSQVRESGATSIRVRFPSAWNPFAAKEQAFVRVTSAMISDGRFVGALQGQYSLEDVRLRVVSAQRLVLLYALLYGLVLLLFGAYVLKRTIANPVRRLKKITVQVADGDLEALLPVTGPREIAEVSTSFNRMLTALKESRQQTQESIDSLRQTNDELRNTSDELIRTEKMASVGHLAAGMAHEIGNPLGATIGYLELLKTELDADRPRKIVEHALQETGRIDRLVRDLLDYAVPTTEEPVLLDLSEVTRETCELLTHQGVFRGVSCRVDLPASLHCATIVRHKLQQVLINLLLNARDASGPGGEICISAGENKDRIWMKVTDNGAGIAPETQDNLFNPFFTTKAPGAGRGLGLSVCYRVIREAGGSIEVSSEEGEGSCFAIRFPRVSD